MLFRLYGCWTRRSRIRYEANPKSEPNSLVGRRLTTLIKTCRSEHKAEQSQQFVINGDKLRRCGSSCEQQVRGQQLAEHIDVPMSNRRSHCRIVCRSPAPTAGALRSPTFSPILFKRSSHPWYSRCAQSWRAVAKITLGVIRMGASPACLQSRWIAWPT